VSDTHRIEELRRRVDNDPASIAFAQLGEAYRRAGDFDGAIGVCRAGLAMHPGYLSARVTLGRTLLVVGDLDGAQSELTSVLKHAPESLAALRGLGDIHHQRGNLGEALKFYRRASALAKHDPDLAHLVEALSRGNAAEGDSDMPVQDVPPELLQLERFLDAIHSYRQRSAV
jgi:tetratricopeptide (TPR) repeat protein